MHQFPFIVGITGRRRHGKDTAASVFVREHGFTLLRFADPIKRMLRSFLWMMFEHQAEHQQQWEETARSIERLVEGDLKEESDRLLAGRSPRYFMQRLGTEFGRELMGRDLWVNALMQRAQAHPLVVVPDVRFQNEAEANTAAGGVIVRVVAVNDDGSPVQPPAGEHVSEEEGDSLAASWVIHNDRRTMGTILGTVAHIVSMTAPLPTAASC